MRSAPIWFLSLLSLAPAARAQVVQAVLPPVGDPGDIVAVSGLGLAEVDTVAFTALVGGFAGSLTIGTVPLIVSDDLVVARVPTFNAFAPPEAVPPGELVGFLQLEADGQGSNLVSFGYLESTFGDVITIGKGGSEPAGFRPRCAFSLAGGLPEAGNDSFQARLYAAPPKSAAVLSVGFPTPNPMPFLGGTSLLDPTLPSIAFFAQPAVQGPFGEAFVDVSIPAPFDGITLVFQWTTMDPTTGVGTISNGLRAEL